MAKQAEARAIKATPAARLLPMIIRIPAVYL